MLSIADTKRNLPERATETATGFLKQPGKEVDEVVGVAGLTSHDVHEVREMLVIEILRHREGAQGAVENGLHVHVELGL